MERQADTFIMNQSKKKKATKKNQVVYQSCSDTEISKGFTSMQILMSVPLDVVYTNNENVFLPADRSWFCFVGLSMFRLCTEGRAWENHS